MSPLPHKIDVQAGALTILQEILHLIAHEPDFEQVVTTLLHAAQEITDANATLFLMFDEPHAYLTTGLPDENLPTPEDLEDFASTITDAFHITSQLPLPHNEAYKGTLVSTIRIKETNVAVFCLLFADGVNIKQDNMTLLDAILNGLKAVTYHVRSRATQDRMMRNQNEFVRIVSHDLRSPLTSMLGFGSMLASGVVGELDERQTHFVDKILSGITQMTSLVDNIQDAGRYDPETGFYEMQRTPTDLVEVVQRIVNNHILPAEKDALVVEFHADENVPIAYVDNTMLERSITNLVDNAIKYTPNEGHVKVEVRHRNNDLLIMVSDDGYGIPTQYQRQLFDRHFRIRRREHNRVKGSGLGLFIVKSVARQHDGDAWVESEEGVGSTFFLKIPLHGRNLIGSASDEKSTPAE